jgi:hypothetical protein
VRSTWLCCLQWGSLPDERHGMRAARAAASRMVSDRRGRWGREDLDGARVFFEGAIEWTQVSVLRRTLQHEPWQVSWLKVTLACRRSKRHLHVDRLPSPSYDRVVLQAASLCLQWRDRAGISPDFPFKPNMGTVGYVCCITLAGLADNPRCC